MKHTLKTAYRSLSAHRSRSGLTILGVVIGITSIMLIMSIGKGAESLILSEIEGFASETVSVRPGREPSGPTDMADTLYSNSLKQRELDAIKDRKNVPDIVDIGPFVLVPGSVSYENEISRPMIMGWSAEFFCDVFSIYPEKGDLFTEEDIEMRTKVAMIGSDVQKELFGFSDALSEYVTIKDTKFKVIGVLPKKGVVAFFNMDDVVVIPYTTAQKDLLGIDYFHEIVTKARSPEATKKVAQDIKNTMRELHDIDDPEKDDFYLETKEAAVSQISTVMGAITIFLSSVVAISLIVGGIGVMNIMLVSVTERTKEIGLRKAIGATNRDILIQFLLEAIILTALGGITGMILGASLSLTASILITKFSGITWKFVFPFSAMILGLSVSSFVGLIFGLYPARQASKKSPIEALRYE